MGDLATNQYPVRINGKITTVSVRGAVGELLISLLLVKLGVHPEMQDAKKSAQKWIQSIALKKPDDFDGGLSEFIQHRIIYEILDPKIPRLKEKLNKKLKKAVEAIKSLAVTDLLKMIETSDKLSSKDITKIQKTLAKINPLIAVNTSTSVKKSTSVKALPKIDTSTEIDILPEVEVSIAVDTLTSVKSSTTVEALPEIDTLTVIDTLPEVEVSITSPVLIDTSIKTETKVDIDFDPKNAQKSPKMVKNRAKKGNDVECASGYRTGNLFGLKLADVANKRVCWKKVA